MTGGVASVVHRLTMDNGSHRDVVVLRQYGREFIGPDQMETTSLISDEAAMLRAVHDAGLPAPEPIAADPDGRESGGHPAILMTRLPGRIDLSPADPDRWLRQIAAIAARIHDVHVPNAPSFRSRVDAAAPAVPSTATRPAVWQAVFAVLDQQPPPASAMPLIHRDLQHFNLLWQRGRLTGVVDWATSCVGPADFDIGHCRLNLAILYGTDRAEQFRHAYEAEVGRSVDPWWDLYAATAYSDGWRQVITRQAAGRVPVDTAGMTSRVEDLLQATLSRMG